MSSKDFFNEIAGDWDLMRANFYSENVREKAFEVAGVKAGEIAADVGAGTGFITEGLLRRGLKVFAIDQSEPMLLNMKSKFEGFADGVYLKGDAEDLPLPDATVDYVFANMYLHHVEAPGEAIQEMGRILKPHGRLTVTDVYQHNFAFLRTEHHDRWLGFSRISLEEWFTSAGLKNVLVNELGEECRVRSNDGHEVASMGIFVASGVK